MNQGLVVKIRTKDVFFLISTNPERVVPQKLSAKKNHQFQPRIKLLHRKSKQGKLQYIIKL